MENIPSPENIPSFVNNFSRAMQLWADSQQQVLQQEISQSDYIRIFCVAVYAATIAQRRLTGMVPTSLLTPEDLGLKFENAEPITLPSILEKGGRVAGYSDFGFGPLLYKGRTYMPDQPGYDRVLDHRFGFRRFEIPDGVFYSPEELLNAMLEKDPRIVLKSKEKRSR